MTVIKCLKGSKSHSLCPNPNTVNFLLWELNVVKCIANSIVRQVQRVEQRDNWLQLWLGLWHVHFWQQCSEYSHHILVHISQHRSHWRLKLGKQVIDWELVCHKKEMRATAQVTHFYLSFVWFILDDIHKRPNTKRANLNLEGTLHGRRDDRLLLLWLVVGQSRPQASILRCSRHPGETPATKLIPKVFDKKRSAKNWPVSWVCGCRSNECFPGPGRASFRLDPQLLGLCASQVNI